MIGGNKYRYIKKCPSPAHALLDELVLYSGRYEGKISACYAGYYAEFGNLYKESYSFSKNEIVKTNTLSEQDIGFILYYFVDALYDLHTNKNEREAKRFLRNFL